MTNYEKFKAELMTILANDEILAVRNGKPGRCGEIPCECCDFRPEKLYVCGEAKRNWLNAEYVEMPKLTRREWHLCKAFEKGWIARDGTERLYLHKEKPTKKKKIWGLSQDLVPIEFFMPNSSFEFIQWEDEEPWSIEDLLKLEVEE